MTRKKGGRIDRLFGPFGETANLDGAVFGDVDTRQIEGRKVESNPIKNSGFTKALQRWQQGF